MKAQINTSRRKIFLLTSLLLVITAAACQNYSEKITNSKSAANETVVIGALRSIASAQTIYSVSHNGEYGTFEQLVSGGNLDARFRGEQPVIGGYVLTMKVSPQSYAVNANPQQAVAAGSTGSRHFYLESNDSGVHVNQTQSASASDPTL